MRALVFYLLELKIKLWQLDPVILPLIVYVADLYLSDHLKWHHLGSIPEKFIVIWCYAFSRCFFVTRKKYWLSNIMFFYFLLWHSTLHCCLFFFKYDFWVAYFWALVCPKFTYLKLVPAWLTFDSRFFNSTVGNIKSEF